MAKSVVIAEDEAIVRLDLSELLTDAGFEVVGVTGRGDEAVELATRYQPDLVVLDIKMPGMDGLQAAAAINAATQSAILVVTAFNERALIEQARDSGVAGYLVKPFRKEELLPAIEIALARVAESSAISAELAALPEGAEKNAARLEARRAIDRAKAKLMDDNGLREPDAFGFIETTAKAQGTTLVEASRQVSEGAIAP